MNIGIAIESWNPTKASVGTEVRPSDIGLLFLVPALLGIVFLTPADIRNSLIFSYAAPTAQTAFTSSYVHFDWVHILVNISMYLLVVPILFILSVASGHRKRFYIVFVTILTAFPPVLSYLNLAVGRTAVTYGFSGVTMAFVGYLPVALAEYLDTRFEIGPKSALAPMAFFVSFSLIAVLSVRSVVPGNRTVLLGTSGLVVVALLSALLYALSAYERGTDFRSKLWLLFNRPGHAELVTTASLLLLAVPFAAFPADPLVNTGILNLYLHLLGYALGFIVTYATVHILDYVDRVDLRL